MPGDALEPLPEVLRRRKREVRRRADRLCHGQRIVAFVEGAILAAVEATLGSDLDAVAAAAARAFDLPKLPQD